MLKGIENSIILIVQLNKRILERLICQAESYGVDPSLEKFRTKRFLQSKVKARGGWSDYIKVDYSIDQKVEIDYLLRRWKMKM